MFKGIILNIVEIVLFRNDWRKKRKTLVNIERSKQIVLFSLLKILAKIEIDIRSITADIKIVYTVIQLKIIRIVYNDIIERNYLKKHQFISVHHPMLILY